MPSTKVSWLLIQLFPYSVLIELDEEALIENDHLGDWSPEKDCC